MRLIDADELRNDWLYNGSNERVYNANDVLESIDSAPTISPVKYGEWVITGHDQHCSLCGFIVSKEGDFTENHLVERLWQYCPSCGCRMVSHD